MRVLTDDLSSPNSRQSGSFNLSGGIAALLILSAIGFLARRRQGMLPAVLSAFWLLTWTAVAVSTHGASTETLREGVREASVVALAVIVYNARGTVNVPISTRLIQLIGIGPAVLALYQLATHTGINIGGQIRANGTFAHPDSAAMFFSIAAVTSLWRYLDIGRSLSDALLATLFSASLIATFGIDGLATLVAMLAVLGLLRPGPIRVKAVPYSLAMIALLAFFATPLGGHRIAREASTSVAAAGRGEQNTSLAWRIRKWKLLLPAWEHSPIFGQGLGATTTTARTPGNPYAGKPPHNEYIRYLVETGVVGLTLLITSLTIVIRRLIRGRRISRSSDAETFAALTIALVVLVGCLVNSLADNTFLNSPTCYVTALTIAAALTSLDLEMRREPTT